MIVVIGDLHFGIRHNNKMFSEILNKEFNWVLNKVTKNDSVVILGDIFDSRSSVDFRILNQTIDFFIHLSKKCKEVFILIGNHDLYYKENKSEYVNCRFLKFNPNGSSNCPVHIVHQIQDIVIQDKKCLFIPWVDNKESKDLAIQKMKESHDVIFGHFDIVGLYGNAFVDQDVTFDQSDFPDNTIILSGHYHRRSKKEKIQYVGSLINATFNDVGDIKGIHFIQDDLTVKFVPGNSPKFEYITIDNPAVFLQAINQADSKTLKQLEKKVSGNIIKLIMNEYNNSNEEVFKKIKGMTPLELTVNYNRVSFDNGDDGESFEGFDTKSDIESIICKYIEKVENNLPSGIGSDQIKLLVHQMHQKFKIAQNINV